jgi:UDP-N-acetyl-D-galactosamine dehydrogenase
MYLEWVGAGSADGDHLRDLAGLALGQSIAELKVAVIGLGYVGLPLAVALANHCRCTGYEIDLERVDELREGLDRTGEITPERLGSSKLTISADEACLAGADVYIVTVPTPVREDNTPDLSMVEAASVLVGRSISSDRTAVIVYESTVFPGVTEEFCGPILERVSGLRCGKDFYLGYSPERINPGDKENTVDKVCKVVSGQTPEVLSLLTKLYGHVTTGGIHQAKSIRVAEAAKVVENTQRDLNIAFMNQLAQGFDLMDISIWDVLETAGTKWNFLKFRPGMVGGHCIGVDPYYLIHRVNELNGSPSLISEARHVNEGMANWLAERVDRTIATANAEILVLGATFKPDVPDVRNSKVPNFIRHLEGLGHRVTCHDPHADPLHARHHLGIEFDREALGRTYDFVVLAVPHQEYLAVLKSSIANLCRQGGAILDVTGQLKEISTDPRIRTLM